MINISYVADGGSPQLVFEGDVSAARIEYAFDAVTSEPEFNRGVGLVVDATNQQHEYSHEEIRELAQHVANKRESFGDRLAVVISPGRELQYGLSRMFSQYAEIHGLTVGIFTAKEEALRWLGFSADS